MHGAVHDYLSFEAGLPGWLAGQLESVARRLSAVPRVVELFWAGVLTFDQLAGFVRTTSSYNGELLVEDLRAPGFRERQERRAERGQRFIAQQDRRSGCSPRR